MKSWIVWLGSRVEVAGSIGSRVCRVWGLGFEFGFGV